MKFYLDSLPVTNKHLFVQEDGLFIHSVFPIKMFKEYLFKLAFHDGYRHYKAIGDRSISAMEGILIYVIYE